ncbi:MAG TPA: hypothetical protein VIF09_09590 [Polyangiaceae bacterium]|jgi:hypothetical protein
MAAWIIQDENYGDIARDELVEAAVEFSFHEPPTAAEGQSATARRVDNATYDLVGRVLVVEPKVWVLDIGGLCIFDESTPPPGVAVGGSVAGRALLGVDPFFYFERLGKQPTMPALIYRWRVLSIARETTPMTRGGGVCSWRDPSKLRWVEVEATNAWVDDDGHGEYVLRCELLADAPKRSRGQDTTG